MAGPMTSGENFPGSRSIRTHLPQIRTFRIPARRAMRPTEFQELHLPRYAVWVAF